MQRHRSVGKVDGGAPASALLIKRTLWLHQRGHVGDRVVDGVTVGVGGQVHGLVEIHRSGRVDRDEREVGAVLPFVTEPVGRRRGLGERGITVVLAHPELTADRIEVDIGCRESALHDFDPNRRTRVGDGGLS